MDPWTLEIEPESQQDECSQGNKSTLATLAIQAANEGQKGQGQKSLDSPHFTLGNKSCGQFKPYFLK